MFPMYKKKNWRGKKCNARSFSVVYYFTERKKETGNSKYYFRVLHFVQRVCVFYAQCNQDIIFRFSLLF